MNYFDEYGNIRLVKNGRNENFPLYRSYLDLPAYLKKNKYYKGWDTCSLEWFWSAGNKVYWQSYPKERGKHMSWENMLGVYMHHYMHNIPMGYLPIAFWNDGVGTNHYAWAIFLSFKFKLLKGLFYPLIYILAWYSLIHKDRPVNDTTGRCRWFAVLNTLYDKPHPLIQKTKDRYYSYIFRDSLAIYISKNYSVSNNDNPILIEDSILWDQKIKGVK